MRHLCPSTVYHNGASKALVSERLRAFRPAVSRKRVIYRPAETALESAPTKEIFGPDSNFCPGFGNNSRKRFLQDRVLDCLKLLQMSFCSKEQETATKRLSWNYTSGIANRSFVLLIVYWVRLKLLKTLPMTAS